MGRGSRRRVAWPLRAALLGLLLLVLLIATAPQLLVPRVERAASDALRTPVEVSRIGIDVFGGGVSLHGVEIGEGAPLTIERITARPDVRRLLRGEILLERVEIEGLDGTAEPGPGGTPELRGLPMPEPGPDDDAGPAVTLQELVLEDVDVEAILPRELRKTPVRVRFDELVARLVPTAELGRAYEAELRGSLDGVPLEARARADETAAGWRIDAGAELAGTPLDNEQITLPPGFESLTATVDGRATYLLDPAKKTERATADLTLRDLRLAGARGTSLAAATIEVRGFVANIAAGELDLGRVTIERPRIEAALTDDGLVYPGLVPELVESGIEPPARDGEEAWKVVGGEIEAKGVALGIRRGAERVPLALPSFSWRGIASGKRGELRTTVVPEDGGSLEAQGALGIDPPELELRTELGELALPSLARLVELPLGITRGTASGTIRLSGEPAAPRVEGVVRAHQVHTAPPRPEQKDRVLAVDRLDAVFTVEPGASGRIDVASLALSYPYAMVQRDAEGVFPLSALATDGAEGEPADRAAPAAESGAARPVRIASLTFTGGRFDFVDQTTQPPYWTGLASTELTATGLSLDSGLERLSASALQDELHPARAQAQRAGDTRWTGSAGVQETSLPALNPYLAPLLGYEARSGRLTVSVDATLTGSTLRATADLALQDVGVVQTGLDVIQRETGVPLTVALALLKDVGGEIALSIPFEVDTLTGEYELGSFVTQAVSRAVLGALSSPLRWLGMLFGRDGPPNALAIDPIPFPAGSARLDDAGAERVRQIGRILASHTELLAIIKAQIAEADVAAVGRDAVAELAARRVDAVRAALMAGRAVTTERIVVVPWTMPADGRLDAAPGVYAELQSS